jgi:L-iditol 2-dehydrogenase
VCYKDLTLTGTNASVPETWLRALDLLGLGFVRGDPIVSRVWPLEAWRDAFDAVQSRGALKVLLEPGAPSPTA